MLQKRVKIQYFLKIHLLAKVFSLKSRFKIVKYFFPSATFTFLNWGFTHTFPFGEMQDKVPSFFIVFVWT